MNPLKFWVAYFQMLIVGIRLYVTNSQSTQCAAIDNFARTPLKPNEAIGRVRIAFFQCTTLAVGGADGDTYELCEIPKGARVIGGTTASEAMGAGVVMAIGITGALTKYGTGIDIAAAGQDDFAHTIALNYGQETAAKERLIATLSGAAPAASKKLWGHVLYVLD